jgi:glycine cleavage system H protein
LDFFTTSVIIQFKCWYHFPKELEAEEGSMKFPEKLLYTNTHEWVKEEGGRVTVGLTDYAQNQLKDIVYVEFPEIGSKFNRGESVGVVESVKTAADLFSPVTGKVAETNVTLKDSPQFINEDPYGKGWILKMELQDKGELKRLLTSEAYEGSLPKEE